MTILTNWKTSIVGVVAAVGMLFAAAYKPGMTWRDWGAAGAVALIGILAKDHTATT
jgi:hypothetical protein